MIRARILPPAESARAIEAGGPLQDLQVDPAKLATMRIAVVEVDDRVVGYWVVWYGLHVEPLWIQEAYRGHPGVARGLLEGMQHIVESSGEQAAFCVLEEENLGVLGEAAERLGFQPAPGVLYYLVVQPPVAAAKE